MKDGTILILAVLIIGSIFGGILMFQDPGDQGLNVSNGSSSAGASGSNVSHTQEKTQTQKSTETSQGDDQGDSITPCPYCGSTDYQETGYISKDSSGDLLVREHCNSCGEDFDLDYGPASQYGY